MFRNTKLLGVSMLPRKNRRALVICVYAFFTALIVIGALREPATLFGNTGLPFVITVLLITRYTFGRLVPNFTYNDEALQQVDTSGIETYSLTSPAPMKTPAADPEPDERDIAVRNAAYFAAFRAIAVYALIVWIEIVAAGDPRLHLQAIAPYISVYAVFSVVLLAFTLPQAIILWNEPDLLAQEN